MGTIFAKPEQSELSADLYDCVNCYDKIQPENYCKTKCGHYFCGTCLDAWLNINTTCPMCRAGIIEHNTTVKQKPTRNTDFISRERQEIINRNIMERY